MNEYRGLDAIARRMRVCKNTILNWHECYGFLMYPRRIGPRTYWVTNDSLINQWELSRCELGLKLKRDLRRRKLDLKR